MELSYLNARVRDEIGDPLQNFRDIAQMDGMTLQFNLSKSKISTNNFEVTVIPAGGSAYQLSPADYTMDFDLGQLVLNTAPPVASTLIISGQAFSMFSDDELLPYLLDAIRWHCYNRQIQERYRNQQGWISYRDTPIGLQNLPSVEEPLLVMRATVNVFWVLANDAATDVNVQSAEGTVIDRGQRYRQLMEQIGSLTDRYTADCMTLNIGPYRMETLEQRKVSQSTGRLIPSFVDREYDDHRYPTRLIHPIDRRDEDNSGVPSQLWYGSPW